MARYTKQAIMETFLKLLKSKSIDKITVKDIVEECGINRNTFYYYYADIYELLEDVFMTESVTGLDKVRACESFYDEYMSSVWLVVEYKDALLHVYNSKARDAFLHYLETITCDFVAKFVAKESEGHALKDEDIDYISQFYSYAIIGHTISWLRKGMSGVPDSFVKEVSESFNATIEDMIRSREK